MKNSGGNTSVRKKKKLPCDLKVFELKGKKKGVGGWGGYQKTRVYHTCQLGLR